MKQMLEKYAHKDCYAILMQKIKYKKKVINLDNVTQENTKIQFKLALYSRPFIQNINDWRLWIRKIKWIA